MNACAFDQRRNIRPIAATRSILLLGVAALLPVTASANLLVTNLGSGNSFDNVGSGWSIDGPGTPQQVIGISFTVSSATTLGDAVLLLAFEGGGRNDPVNVYLESDAAGEPGVILASLPQVGAVPDFSGPAPGLVTFTCSTGCGLPSTSGTHTPNP